MVGFSVDDSGRQFVKISSSKTMESERKKALDEAWEKAKKQTKKQAKKTTKKTSKNLHIILINSIFVEYLKRAKSERITQRKRYINPASYGKKRHSVS